MSEKTDTEQAIKDELDLVAAEHSIKPGSPAMEAFLSAGYADIGTREHANEIIEGWKKDHSSCPWDLKQRAIAYLEALDAKPKASDIYHPATDRRGAIIPAKKGARSPGRQVATRE
jgi:hypothetical protein